MGAYAELEQSGECGPGTLALLRRLGAQVVGTSSFPPPDGHRHWDADAVDDLLADMFARSGRPFLLGCFLKATDDASLERLLLASIRNHLIDQAKTTNRGKLRRRLDGLLSKDTRFARGSVGGSAGWAVQGTIGSPWQGDVEDLHRAAASVRGVAVWRWNESGPTPRATVNALVTVAHAVLTAAGGVVRDEDLARVIEGRFALLAPPITTALSGDDAWADPPAPAEDGPEALTVAEIQAEELWDSLSASERALLPHLGAPAEQLAAVLETGPKTANAIAAGLAEKLRTAVSDEELVEDVIAFLLRRCVVRP
ncbi:MAG: hypothetical protein IPJ14_07850 [Kineosporiaceae bacterium]|nr:hypothetical protein [Kineosporiaceae bacterium]MBK7622565.1 hypothetical protein [Kineosporiaceae bacterium]